MEKGKCKFCEGKGYQIEYEELGFPYQVICSNCQNTNSKFDFERHQKNVQAMLGEDNKLFSEFLGVKFDETLVFLVDWNLLLRVVDKIESLKTFDKDRDVDQCWRVNIFDKRCVISFASCVYGWTDEFEYIENSKLEAVYNAVLEFVQWYNKQK